MKYEGVSPVLLPKKPKSLNTHISGIANVNPTNLLSGIFSMAWAAIEQQQQCFEKARVKIVFPTNMWSWCDTLAARHYHVLHTQNIITEQTLFKVH